ncbi:matrix [Carajas virus]|uniref:Matrix protein n=1 Tax=Carajas virus TaxID=239239 RepID=A0A0D3R252_9RHAB|nr:matrix [Carajas virus]AJR28530.1 matrix [Carajas virus]
MSSLKKILGLKGKKEEKSKKLGLPPPYEMPANNEFEPNAPLDPDMFGAEHLEIESKSAMRYEKFKFSVKITLRTNRPLRTYDDVCQILSKWDAMYVGMMGKRPFYKVLVLIGSSHLQATPAILSDRGQPEYHMYLEDRGFIAHRLGLTPPMLSGPESFRRPFHVGLYRGTIDITVNLMDDESTESAPQVWDHFNTRYVNHFLEHAKRFGLVLSKKPGGGWILDQAVCA